MKACVLIEPGRIEIEARPIPKPEAGEIVLKIRSALTCGTDLKAYKRGHPVMPMPTLLGHEFSGEVAAVGEGVNGFREGDSIMAVHSAPCGECYWCVRGQGNLCRSIMDTKVLGAFAEYLKLPSRIVRQNAFHKPPSLSWETAALLEPLACVVYGLSLVEFRPDDTVLVIGAGAIGLLHIAALKAKGINRVICAGKHRARLDAAQTLGAEIIDVGREELKSAVLGMTEGRGADTVIECTGQPGVWEQSIRLARRGGQVILFGGCPSGTQVTFDAGRLHYDQITLHSPFHFTPSAVRQSYEMLCSGRLPLEGLISGSYPLDEIQTAFERLIAGQGIKYELKP